MNFSDSEKITKFFHQKHDEKQRKSSVHEARIRRTVSKQPKIFFEKYSENGYAPLSSTVAPVSYFLQLNFWLLKDKLDFFCFLKEQKNEHTLHDLH